MLPAGPPPMITKRNTRRQASGGDGGAPSCRTGLRRLSHATRLTSCHAGRPMTTLWLEPCRRGRRHLVLRYGVDDLRFATTYWYDDVDFDELARPLRRGVPAASSSSTCWPSRPTRRPAWRPRRSTRPVRRPRHGRLLGSVVDAVPPRLGRVALRERPPRLPPAPPAGSRVRRPSTRLAPVTIGARRRPGAAPLRWRQGQPGQHEAARARRHRLRHVRLQRTRCTGRRQFQHDAHRAARRRGARRTAATAGWVVDDADGRPRDRAPYPELGIERIVAAETVSSYWTALPVALQHGSHEVALGVTRSTDEHNLVWDVTGERINYLWGMSSAAEQLLHDYVRTTSSPICGCSTCSARSTTSTCSRCCSASLDAVPSTHSCARQKPWCGRCAKCIYVWMQYVAWLPAETVARCLADNLFDVPRTGRCCARCSDWRATSRPTAWAP